jgi:hypothetical protein
MSRFLNPRKISSLRLSCFRFNLVLAVTCFSIFFAAKAYPSQVIVGWNPNSDPVAGYKVYYGLASGNYTNNVDAGNNVSCTLRNLTNPTYFIAATAYDTNHSESAFSQELVVHSMAASAGAGGSITPTGTFYVAEGASQTFIIAPSANYRIVDFQVDGRSVGAVNSYTLNAVNAPHTIAASFALNISSFTVTSSAGANGSISPSGKVSVNSGANQTFTITPAANYKVSAVTVDGVSAGAVPSFTFSNVKANHTIAASFAFDTHIITGTAGENGTIDPSGSVQVKHGADQTFTITPVAGFRVEDVHVDGTSIGAVSQNTFKNVSTNHTISATFSIRSIWYVDDNIAYAGDGKAWANAFKTVQQALDSASSGDEIWVKASDYALTEPLVVDKPVKLYGGFAGYEDQLDQRNWRIYTTSLNGQRNTQCLQLIDNATIDGFVITKCQGNLGGGVFSTGAKPRFACCKFVENSAGFGGAVYALDSTIEFNTCMFSGNTANQGGAIYNQNSVTTIGNCTFSGNSVSSGGGAIDNNSGGAVTIVDSILWADKQGSTPNEIEDSVGTVTVTYSDIQGGYAGDGNINQNPHFVDAAGGLLALRPTSPCIDAGAGRGFATWDLDLNPRLMDGDGGGAVVDMGAYEYDPKMMTLIDHHYHSILNRNPDVEGSRSWWVAISQLVSQGVSPNAGLLALAKSFFNSSEYLGLGKSDVDFVTDLYLTYLNRVPDSAGEQAWLDQLAAGMTRNGVMYSFAYSSEFKRFIENTFGRALARPEADMVNDFYRGILARIPDVGGFKSWVAAMRNAQCAGVSSVKNVSRQLAMGFFNSDEYKARKRDNAGYVEDLYDAILRRGPGIGGFNFWVGQLNSGATRQALLDSFINTLEFQGRVDKVIAAGCMQ